MECDWEQDGRVASLVANLSAFAPKMALKIQSLRQTLLYRTTALKLQSLPHAHGLAVAYNETSEAVNVEDYNDPFRVEWNAVGDRQIIVGADVRRPSLYAWAFLGSIADVGVPPVR